MTPEQIEAEAMALAEAAVDPCKAMSVIERDLLETRVASAVATVLTEREELKQRLEEKEREVGRINSFIRLIKYGVGDRARPYSREELMGFADDCINKRPLPDDEYWGDQ